MPFRICVKALQFIRSPLRSLRLLNARRDSKGVQGLVLAAAAAPRRTDRDRVVTNLELFYDLVYVAVIGRRPITSRGRHRWRLGVRRGLRPDLVRLDQRLALPRAARPPGRPHRVHSCSCRWGSGSASPCSRPGQRAASGGRSRSSTRPLLAVMGWQWFSVRGQDEPQYRT